MCQAYDKEVMYGEIEVEGGVYLHFVCLRISETGKGKGKGKGKESQKKKKVEEINQKSEEGYKR